MANILNPKPQDKPKIILILGMHRSGTSLVAQMVAKWGAYMGDDLMQANEYNKEGYWEYNPLVQLNDKILNYLGNTWYTPPFSINLSLLINVFGKEAYQLIDKMDKHNTTWCWKDPRMVSLLPFWEKIFSDREIVLINCIRSPLAVANSLLYRNNMPQEVSYALWLFSNIAVINLLYKGLKHINIIYEELISSSNEVCLKLFSFLNSIELSPKPDSVLISMKSCINPDLSNTRLNSSQIKKSYPKDIIDCFINKNYSNKKNQFMLELESSRTILNLYSKSNIHKANKLRIQLFISSNNQDYNEKDSIKSYFEPNIEKVTFKLNNYESITSLRFDPFDNWAAIMFDGLELFSNNESIAKINNFKSNAHTVSNNILLFNYHDPQMHFDLTSFRNIKIDHVVFHIQYLSTEDATKINFAENVSNKNLRIENPTYQLLLEELKKDIRLKQKYIAQANKTVTILQNNIREKELELSSKNSEIKSLNKKIGIYTNQILELKLSAKKTIELINNLTHVQNSNKELLAIQNDKIINLTSQISAYKNSISFRILNPIHNILKKIFHI